MPLTVSFTTAQFLGLGNIIYFTDTSTGSDVAVTERHIKLLKYDGTYLVPSGTLTNYILWPLGVSSSISIDVLQYDQSFTITVEWVNVSGTVLYSKTQFGIFNMYAKTYNDLLIAGQQANPRKVSDTNYYLNRIKLTIAIVDAVTSITDMSDVTNSQQACDDGTFLVENAANFF